MTVKSASRELIEKSGPRFCASVLRATQDPRPDWEHCASFASAASHSTRSPAPSHSLRPRGAANNASSANPQPARSLAPITRSHVRLQACPWLKRLARKKQTLERSDPPKAQTHAKECQLTILSCTMRKQQTLKCRFLPTWELGWRLLERELREWQFRRLVGA